MRKINLQMFAWDPNSIVDYLKSTGQDSSYTARKEMAASLGIENYAGTGEQNTQMLNMLRNGASAATNTTSTSSGTKTSGTTNKTSGTTTKKTNTSTKTSNASTKTSNTSTKTFTQSSTSKAADKKAQEQLGSLDEFNVDQIVSQDTIDAMNTPFNVSTAYTDAMNVTNQLREQITSGKTTYSDQVQALLNDIQNREKFSYDMSNDTLFQQSLASAMASGKTAMQDTMGQASALTGGYGSSYATSAANQTYNSFIEDAYNNLPEYYQMALQAYEMEGNEMYKQLSALSEADDREYGRLVDAYNINFDNAESIYDKEYTQWQDTVNNAYKSAGLQIDDYNSRWNTAYGTYNAYQNNAEYLYGKEFDQWQAETDVAYKYDALAQDDAHHNDDMAYKYDALAQDDAHHNDDMDYKYAALAQDDAQHKATLAQDQSQFDATMKQRQAESEAKLKDPKDPTYDSLTTSEINGLKTHCQKVLDNGGSVDDMDKAAYDYIRSLGKNVDNEILFNLLETMQPTKAETKSLDKTPIYDMDWTYTSGNNFTNGSVTMTYKEIEKEINSNTKLDSAQKKTFLSKLKAQMSDQ